MIVIMKVKKLKKLCQDYYSRGIAKGYEFGYRAGQASQKNKGCIIGSQLDKEIDEILRKRNEG